MENVLLLQVVNEADVRNFDLKAAKSKLDSLESHLESILQKKIRLDLEIKRTRSKISKLKSRCQTLVKASVSLEGFDYDHMTQDKRILLEEQIGSDKIQEIIELEKTFLQIEDLLDVYKDLPLYTESD